MKKLLIIGASVLQLPAIRKAKEMGLYVAVADYDPHAVGIPFADEYFNASTIDEAAVCRVAQQFRPDGIMTLATDMPMRSIAKAAALLGLPGISYDTAIKATDKYEMIRAFKAHAVPSPWYFLIPGQSALDALRPQLTYPCILKPTDNSGSRGVVLVHSFEELREAYAYSSRQARRGQVIIEEYLRGPEVSVEVMVVDAVPHILQITDKLTTGAPHFVEMGHSQPSGLPDSVQEAICSTASQAVQAIGIQSGPAHVEMIVTSRGPVLVELGARMGGDCITTHLVPLSTGIDMVRATIETALGLRPDIEPKFQKGSAIRYFDVPSGIIKSISGIPEAEKIGGVQEITFTKTVGDPVTGIASSTDRVGFVVAQSDSAQSAVSACEQALHAVKIDL